LEIAGLLEIWALHYKRLKVWFAAKKMVYCMRLFSVTLLKENANVSSRREEKRMN
jgi:hypothetical protein